MPSPATDVLTVLRELVAIDTRNPGGDELALAARVSELLRASKPSQLLVREVARARDGSRGGYVFARWGEPRILVNAHLDTVAVGAGWSGDPFTLRVEGGRATALGAADTKGAIAAMLVALAQGTPRDVAVLFSGDEEQGGASMEAFLKSDERAEAKRLELAIACEPTRCLVGHRHRGILALEVDAAGVGGHSSRADSLPAPLVELARVATAIGAWGVAHVGRGPAGFEGMCTNIAELRGGVGFNIVPPQGTLVVSIRPPPGAALSALEDELRVVALAAAPGVVVRRVLANPSFETRNVDAFRPFLGAACGAPIDLGFWTEAALLERDGINAVVYGPGDIARAHGADEWVSIDELEQACKQFAMLVSCEKPR
jgi:acetylornithine deacetylase